jgi:hypothetical protein
MHTPTIKHKRRARTAYSRKGRPIPGTPLFRDQPAVKAIGREATAMVEPLLSDKLHSYRPRRSVQTAARHIESMPGHRMGFDILSYYPSIDQTRLRRKVNHLDPTIWPRIEPWLPRTGLPIGSAFSNPLANLYLSDIDARYPIVRYCDNIVLVSDEPEREYIRLRRHLSDIGLECHDEVLNPTRFCGVPLQPTGGGRAA